MVTAAHSLGVAPASAQEKSLDAAAAPAVVEKDPLWLTVLGGPVSAVNDAVGADVPSGTAALVVASLVRASATTRSASASGRRGLCGRGRRGDASVMLNRGHDV